MGATLDPSKRAALATEALEAALPGKVTTLDAIPEHTNEQSRPWSQTCWSPAAAYVKPSTAEEVAEVLRIVSRTESKFAVRSTGHNPNPGFSSVDECGIVIDLGNLNSKTLGNNGILHAGAGNTWGDVYPWLEDQKRSAMGGRETAVGLSGFLLGGGLGPFPNLHGTGADGVVNYEVVLANGTIVNANANTNEDLFQALKGGGSNFGIVTRFDLTTYPLINIQYTIRLYNPTDLVNILEAVVQVHTSMETDPKIGLFTNFRKDVIVVGLFYADWTAEISHVFDAFYRLTSLIDVMLPPTQGSFTSLVKTLGQFHPPEPGKRSVSTVTSKVSRDLYAEVYKVWRDSIKTLATEVDLHFTIQPITKDCVQAGEQQGGNVMGLEQVSQCWFVFTAEWTNGGDDIAVQRAHDTITQRVQKLADEKGLLLSYLSMTFAHSSQRVLRGYGAGNVKRLQDAASKYDPDGLFQSLQNNGFLLRDL